MTPRTRLLALVAASIAVLGAWLVAGRPAGEPASSTRGPRRAAEAMATASPLWPTGAIAVAEKLDDGTAIVLVAPGDGTRRVLLRGFDDIGRSAWSPDGTALAFGARQAANWDLYRVNIDGSGLMRLTTHPAYDGAPAWSPDGTALAFESYRDGSLDLYRMPASATEGAGGEPDRLIDSPGPAIEPAWSPDGRWIAFAQFAEGAYHLDGLELASGQTLTLLDGSTGGPVDRRAPAWSPSGDRLAFLEHGGGSSVVRVAVWRDDVLGRPRSLFFSARTEGFAWSADGRAVAMAKLGRSDASLELGALDGARRHRVADLPGAGALAWGPRAAPGGLASHMAGDAAAPGAVADPDARPGFVRLDDVEVPNERINGALAADFEALRIEVQAATGRDFLGTLSDGWRPLGYKSDGSAFFSWHKVGRAFDTSLELGPGLSGMVLVREELAGRTAWRMFLRAGPQDGTVGAPLREPAWDLFARFENDATHEAGGRRADRLPTGYYLDFTALAARYGWQRIAAHTGAGFDWRTEWEAIEFWHFERRDGLRWFEAALQVYTEEELAAQLAPERLRSLGITSRLRTRAGLPRGWPPGG